jgi:lipoprotein-releasing system permease protein
MPFELQIALRYLLARRRQAFISIISFVSTLGVTVGVLALILAMAMMTGLQSELRDRILGSTAHALCSRPRASGLSRRNRAASQDSPRRRRGAGDRRRALASTPAVRSSASGIDPSSN